MINATSPVLESYLTANSFVDITTTTSVIAIALLILVAAQRELLRTIRPNTPGRDFAAFAVVIVPMAMVFASIIVIRFIELS